MAPHLTTQALPATGWDKAMLAVSCAVMLLALVVLSGWHAHIPAAVQLFQGLTPMPYNTALCFVALGAAGTGLATRRWPLLLLAGACAACVGAAAVLEYASGVSFGVDTWFFAPQEHGWLAGPGRMALTTATSFLLSGVALVSVAVRRHSYAVLGMANSVTLSLALTSLIGYAFQASYVLPFSPGSQMAPPIALAFLASSLATLGYAWVHAERGPDGLPRWCAGIGVAFLPVLFVGTSALVPDQPWQMLPLDALLALVGVALIALAIQRLTTVKVAYKGLLMIAMPLLLLLTFVGLVVQVKQQSEAAQVLAQHSARVSDVSQSLMLQIVDVESGSRGYLITHDEAFVQAHATDLAAVAETAAQLRDLVSDNPSQQASARRIELLAAQRMDHLRTAVGTVRLNDRLQTEAITRDRSGIALMNHLRAEMRLFTEEEERLGTVRQRAVDASWQKLSWLLISGTAAAILLASIFTLSFSGGISRRLKWLQDNAVNLAAGKALAPPLAGDDEIAELDRVFHAMADALAEITQREKANRMLAEQTIDVRHTEALLKTGALQNAIFNSANFSSIATDERGVIQIFNVGAERMLGYTAAEVMNKITPADISDPQEVIARAQALSLELGTSITPGFEALVFKASRGIEDIYELTYIRKDGSRFSAIVSITALRDAADTIIGYLLIGTDNTVRKQVEATQALLDQRLRDQQFYTRSLIESNIDALMMTNPQGIISDVNQQMIALTGRTRDELIGAPSKNFFTDPLLADAAIKRVLTEGKVSNYELTVRALNGQETVVSYNAATFHDRDRKLQGVFAAARDVTERKRIELTLQEKNIELEHANRMKSEFLATMSHELRTPLNAIIGFSEALKDGLMGQMSEVQQEYIGDIFTSGQHLLSLINDILDLSKVEAGMMKLDLEPADLHSLLSNCLSIVKEKAALQRLQLELRMDGDFGLIMLDTRKTKQIVYNLLANAVKFSAPGGHVTLGARRVLRGNVGRLSGVWPVHGFPLADNGFEAFLEISVSDQGIGISQDNMVKLFQAFSQIDSSLARRFEGTGLGLAMVRQLADLHGGTVAVASAEGEGAQFMAWLPMRVLVDDAGHPAPAV